MIKKLFINSIAYILGDTPSDAEYLSALRYVSENLEDTDDMDKIGTLLLDWRHDCCAECDWCGKYHLIEEMESDCGNWFCCDKCKEEYEQDEDWEAAHNREVQSMWNER